MLLTFVKLVASVSALSWSVRASIPLYRRTGMLLILFVLWIRLILFQIILVFVFGLSSLQNFSQSFLLALFIIFLEMAHAFLYNIRSDGRRVFLNFFSAFVLLVMACLHSSFHHDFGFFYHVTIGHI